VIKSDGNSLENQTACIVWEHMDEQTVSDFGCSHW